MNSLRRLCEKTETDAAARGARLHCRFDLDGIPVELPNPYRTTLLRAAQASLANVWVHAKAGTAVVTCPSWAAKWPWTSTTTVRGSIPRRSRPPPGATTARVTG